MKTPNWATAIGIIMIVFGGCGAFNDIKSIRMPEDLAKQKELIKKSIEEEKESEKDSTDVVNAEVPVDSTAPKSGYQEFSFLKIGTESPEKMLTLSPFTATWIVRFGYIGAVASFIYLLGGVFLLVRKTFSIKLAYAALIVSILCSGFATAVLSSNASGDFLGITLGLSQIPGIIIDIILLAVIFASDKDAFKLENLSR